jgi:hypothetical protein
MGEYIEKETIVRHLEECKGNPPEMCYTFAVIQAVESFVKDVPAADVAPVVHGVPISKNRPQKYEVFEEASTGENGETLYRKRICVDEKNSVEYCPACGKRLCSRFRSFCPNCGARMDGERE